MKNISDKTWVLVYENNRVVSIIEPGLETQCGGIQTLKEFDTLEQLKQFITDNGLIDETNNPI